MKKSLLPFSVQVKSCANLLFKLWQFSILLLFLTINSLSAQEVTDSEITSTSTASITVVGEAFIYSKDAGFNEQISQNVELHKHTNVEFTKRNEVKISAKNTKGLTEDLNHTDKKAQNIVIASKKKKEERISVDIPKKKIDLYIKKLDSNDQFIIGSSFSRISFLFPSNDNSLSKYFVISSDKYENSSILFSYYVNYYYENDIPKSQLFSRVFTVRPPPDLI